MTTTIKAIDTPYAGHLFRSRLEARWAVVLDTAGIPWEYESEGYELPNGLGRYLPDFYLPTLNTFLEVKGTAPTQDEKQKLLSLCKARNAFGCFGLSLQSEMPFYQDLGDYCFGSHFQENSFPAHWPDGLDRLKGSEMGDLASVPTTRDNDLDCPICCTGDGYAHTGTPKIHMDGTEGCNARGPVTTIPVVHEICGHEWNIMIAFHKGNTRLAYYYPRAEGQTPIDTVMRTGIFCKAFKAGREARFEHGRSGN